MYTFLIYDILGNMAPGQLKKLLNKQRKAQRKAQEEKAQALAAQEKRDMHKNRQQVTNTSDEADALPLDELLPEKLERVSDIIYIHYFRMKYKFINYYKYYDRLKILWNSQSSS